MHCKWVNLRLWHLRVPTAAVTKMNRSHFYSLELFEQEELTGYLKDKLSADKRV